MAKKSIKNFEKVLEKEGLGVIKDTDWISVKMYSTVAHEGRYEYSQALEKLISQEKLTKRNRILRLHSNGVGIKQIAKSVGVSRGYVEKLLSEAKESIRLLAKLAADEAVEEAGIIALEYGVYGTASENINNLDDLAEIA